MTKIRKSKLKYARTVQENLFGSPKFKGQRPPGQHGGNLKRKKITEYGLQTRETKKLRLFYGIKLKKLKSIFAEASKIEGNKVNNFVGLLERRLSSCVYRANFASSIDGAKQLISHGHIRVNQKKVNLSSYLVRAGDIVSLEEGRIRENHHVLSSMSNQSRTLPDHLDLEKFQAKFKNTPGFSDNLYFCTMRISSVVEFLSK